MIRFINPGIQPPIYLDTANQRVGIGTATPNVPLEVKSAGANTEIMRITASDDVQLFNFAENSSGDSNMSLKNTSGTVRWFFHTNGNSYCNNSTGFVFGATSVNSTALFEISSTTKGFLPPRMTTTEKNAISSPATGLVVYDTTLNKLCVYTGAAWQTVTSA